MLVWISWLLLLLLYNFIFCRAASQKSPKNPAFSANSLKNGFIQKRQKQIPYPYRQWKTIIYRVYLYQISTFYHLQLFSEKKSALLWDIDINKDFKEWKWWLLLKRILCKWPKQLDFTIHCNFLVGSKVNYRVFQFLSVMDPAGVVQGVPPKHLQRVSGGCKGTLNYLMHSTYF